jgi:hypothetical protein
MFVAGADLAVRTGGLAQGLGGYPVVVLGRPGWTDKLEVFIFSEREWSISCSTMHTVPTNNCRSDLNTEHPIHSNFFLHVKIYRKLAQLKYGKYSKRKVIYMG